MSNGNNDSPANGRTKVAFFSTKSYDKDYFTEFNKKNSPQGEFAITFFEPRLSEQTVIQKLLINLPIYVCLFTYFFQAKLAIGYDVVCLFVNDVCNAKVLAELHKVRICGLFIYTWILIFNIKGGVRLIALRCAGFNNVDLEKAKELGMPILRVVCSLFIIMGIVM